MFKHLVKVAWRNFARNKIYSSINILGLSMGMAIALLIGLWIHDELSFNQYHKNYDRLAQVMSHTTANHEIFTYPYNPSPMGDELRNNYGDDFKTVVLSSFTERPVLRYQDKKIVETGDFMEPGAPDMLSLEMVEGSGQSLNDPMSILLSASTARAFFGEEDPLGKILTVDQKTEAKVAGIYKDIPYNSDFKDLAFVAPWKMYLSLHPEVRDNKTPWAINNYQVFVVLADHADLDKVSSSIRDVRLRHMPPEAARSRKPQVFLHPMPKWHLYSEFKNGVNTGGRIQFVWLFGIIGLFVLLLACINFMNLSTARSEMRAKEVGVRKTIGSLRIQLILQFLTESILSVLLAFIFSILWLWLILPLFNGLADKRLNILWGDPLFWLYCLVFCLFTGLGAGLYPAFYLSSFKPVRVLKGVFRSGRNAALPRKILVVLQFTVSVVLIIGTIVVFRQIRYASDRPVGYDWDGLISINANSDIMNGFEVIRNELKSSGAIVDMAEATSPTTDYYADGGAFNWQGKDPTMSVDFAINMVSMQYGKTVGWQIKEGRDFSTDFPSDSTAVILNESAINFMGLKDPVGQTIEWTGKPYKIVGVIKDIIYESPYRQVKPCVFFTTGFSTHVIAVRINTRIGTTRALEEVGRVFSTYDKGHPFAYTFVDDVYAQKFSNERRIGKLAGMFSVLAIFISCLGLFGMASFTAEQRIKEISVRKVLGASVFILWRLLSKDFVILVCFALLLAIPLSYFLMSRWLQGYAYRSGISWWIFVMAAAGALVITLLTVSYHILRAATTNPTKSLRTE
ncbi:ABC transporter permease [Puia dinghuensis]|uniref:ABC transporter permease n=1 Tax=Puia dinghuensis TaxID=1792502 RepID=A0A8J2UH48_9BACT|nr:ABC transporter permease [Puia dinghuensis]GGB14545.1 ABC transporter permease [Puia dinghuensis]